MYNLMSFERYVITTIATTIIKILANCITLKNFLPLESYFFPFSSADSCRPICFLSAELHLNEILYKSTDKSMYSFLIWILSCRIINLRFIQVVTYITSLLLFIFEECSIEEHSNLKDLPFSGKICIFSSVERHGGCLLTNKLVVNIYVQCFM